MKFLNLAGGEPVDLDESGMRCHAIAPLPNQGALSMARKPAIQSGSPVIYK
jgi:hypothetical protein